MASVTRLDSTRARLAATILEIGSVVRDIPNGKEPQARSLEISVLQTAPDVKFITNGDLRGSSEYVIRSRIALLPPEHVADTAARLDALLAVAASSHFKFASNATDYLKEMSPPVIIPEHGGAFTLLKSLSEGLVDPGKRDAYKSALEQAVSIDSQVRGKVYEEIARRYEQRDPTVAGLTRLVQDEIAAVMELRGSEVEKAKNAIVEQKIAEMKATRIPSEINANLTLYGQRLGEIISRDGLTKDNSQGKTGQEALARLKVDLRSGIAAGEIEAQIARTVVADVIESSIRIAIRAALRQVGAENALFGDAPSTAGRIIEIATREIASLGDVPDTSTVRHVGSQTKQYTFIVPGVDGGASFGKVQLVDAEALLRYSRVTRETTVSEMGILAKEFADTLKLPGNYHASSENGELKWMVDAGFSAVGRGAGSAIAGIPLITFDKNPGIRIGYDHEYHDPEQMGKRHVDSRPYGSFKITNSLTFSPYSIAIGEPYAGRMGAATALFADLADTVAGNLSHTYLNGRNGSHVLSVAELETHIRENLHELANRPYEGAAPGRNVIKIDYFTLYPPEIRAEMLERFFESGSMDGITKDAAFVARLADLTRNGGMRLAMLDISGGYDGAGVSEMISIMRRGTGANQIEHYVRSVVQEFASKTGRTPKNVLIASREGMMTAFQFEHRVLQQSMLTYGRHFGIESVGITDLEMVEQSIAVARQSGSAFRVPTLDGRVIEPDVIVKLFAYPYGTRHLEEEGLIIPELPGGAIFSPTPSSRKVISDKRINSALLNALRNELDAHGVDVFPAREINVALKLSSSFSRATDQIIEFMRQNADRYPDMAYTGAILKLSDKLERTDGSEVRSVYPIPAGAMAGGEVAELFVYGRLKELYETGGSKFIVQPNVVTLTVDNDGNIPPKFEVRVAAYSDFNGNSPLRDLARV